MLQHERDHVTFATDGRECVTGPRAAANVDNA